MTLRACWSPYIDYLVGWPIQWKSCHTPQKNMKYSSVVCPVKLQKAVWKLGIQVCRLGAVSTCHFSSAPAVPYKLQETELWLKNNARRRNWWENNMYYTMDLQWRMWEREFRSEMGDRISHNSDEKLFFRYVCLMTLCPFHFLWNFSCPKNMSP